LRVPQGISIHVGLNQVDPSHYQGWDGKLVACEFDANDMAKLAEGKGFKTTTLLTREAKADALLGEVGKAAEALDDGDILVCTYSGHGGQVPDANGDEDDRMDETWVLYDRQIVDDELYAQWAKFKPGVRVAIFSDSCHSGTVARGVVDAVGADPWTTVATDNPARRACRRTSRGRCTRRTSRCTTRSRSRCRRSTRPTSAPA
jgi:hypothetical protein